VLYKGGEASLVWGKALFSLGGGALTAPARSDLASFACGE